MQQPETALAAASPPGQTMAQGLAVNGYWVQRWYFNAGLAGALRRELNALYNKEKLTPAGIGRGRDYQLNKDIRGDVIYWLRRQSMAQRLFLDRMERIRIELNQELFLGLFDFECHFALYAPGAFYREHLDSFKGAANRMVSVVAYLNRDWRANDGGELLIYGRSRPSVGSATLVHPVRRRSSTSLLATQASVQPVQHRRNEAVCRVPPHAGTLAVFLSEEIPHEVLPARRDRVSIAGWFRINNSLWGQVDPPR